MQGQRVETHRESEASVLMTLLSSLLITAKTLFMKPIIVVLMLCLLSCRKESSTRSTAYWNNLTAHTIEIRPFSRGTVPPGNIVLLKPGDKFLAGAETMRGILNGAGYDIKYFDGADSIQVVFDGQHGITHYFNTPSVLGPKHYLFSSTRNIGNSESYQYTYRDVNKRFREQTFTYEFTEQDYLDAK